ncbi:hypothetical protein ACHAW5_007554 [Stephanodiscus triporus]|uniref:Mitochondrial fission process protein 1 n=1 Tax=Stephanodiscus triporus TaxID=2934178 RepID=A0ABD3NI13_9STRA
MSPTSDAHTEPKSSGAYNIFRDSPLRYCGYANEYPRLVSPSYLIAFGYCVADAASAGYRVMSEEDNVKEAHETHSKNVRAVSAGIDTLLWQGLASVVIPGGVINCKHCDVIEYNCHQIFRHHNFFIATLFLDYVVYVHHAVIVYSSRIAVARTIGLPVYVSKWLPTAVGLFSIPIIIHPIDNAVDFLLDNTTRYLLKIRSTNN